MASTTAVKTRPLPVGTIIDNLWAAREEKRTLEAQTKEVEGKIKEIEEGLMERLDAEGMDKATGRKASVSVTSSVVADVQDWDLLYPYIAKNKYWHLLQKRVSDPSVRELWDAGKKVPGILPFTRKKLNIRTVA
jgi:hypothetical protein